MMKSLSSAGHSDIGALIRVSGSIRSAASKAGVDQGAVSRWLAGKPTLSTQKLVRVQVVLGLVDGKPDPDRVHMWEPRKLPSSTDLNAALSLFFPRKPEAAVAPWSHLGKGRLLKMATFDFRPEIAAFYDGQVMVVLRTPAGLMINPRRLRVSWRGGKVDRSELDPTTIDLLLSGQPSPEEFKRAWAAAGGRTPETLDAAVKGAGISYPEAIERVSRPHS